MVGDEDLSQWRAAGAAFCDKAIDTGNQGKFMIWYWAGFPKILAP
jgi:hypothetical protein